MKIRKYDREMEINYWEAQVLKRAKAELGDLNSPAAFAAIADIKEIFGEDSEIKAIYRRTARPKGWMVIDGQRRNDA